MAVRSSGMIRASGARGPGLIPRNNTCCLVPLTHIRSPRVLTCSTMPTAFHGTHDGSGVPTYDIALCACSQMPACVEMWCITVLQEDTMRCIPSDAKVSTEIPARAGRDIIDPWQVTAWRGHFLSPRGSASRKCRVRACAGGGPYALAPWCDSLRLDACCSFS